MRVQDPSTTLRVTIADFVSNLGGCCYEQRTPVFMLLDYLVYVGRPFNHALGDIYCCYTNITVILSEM